MENLSFQHYIKNPFKNLIVALLAATLSSCAPRINQTQKILWVETNPIIVQEWGFEKVLDFFAQNFWKNIIFPENAFYFSNWSQIHSIYSQNQPRYQCQRWTTISNVSPWIWNFWVNWDYEQLKDIFKKNWINIDQEIVFQSWKYTYYVTLKNIDNNQISFCSIVRK